MTSPNTGASRVSLSLRAFVRLIAQYRRIRRNPAQFVEPVDPVSTRWFGQFLFTCRVNPRTLVLIGYSGASEDTGLGHPFGDHVTLFSQAHLRVETLVASTGVPRLSPMPKRIILLQRTHAFNHQVYGEKEWYLYSPDQTPLLYPREKAPNQSDVDDVLNPDLEKYPRFSEAVPHRAVTGPGEMLFLPAGWWHTTRIWGPSISIAINCVNWSNWDGMVAELAANYARRNRLIGPVLTVYLGALGRCKRLRDRWTGNGGVSSRA